MSDNTPQKIVHFHQGKQNFNTVMTAGPHDLTADEPVSMGGKDAGPDPYDYLLMALGSCSAITMRMYAERKQWPLADVYLELRHYKTHAKDCKDCEDKDAHLDYIEKEIILKGDLTDDQKDKLLEIAGKCPVHRTLLNTVKITSSLGLTT
ncbi:MAG: OsmC family protein [Balneolales bacterium]